MIRCDNDGEYHDIATYTPDCVGQHEVLISVNGEPLTGNPWRVLVTPQVTNLYFHLVPMVKDI